MKWATFHIIFNSLYFPKIGITTFLFNTVMLNYIIFLIVPYIDFDHTIPPSRVRDDIMSGRVLMMSCSLRKGGDVIVSAEF